MELFPAAIGADFATAEDSMGVRFARPEDADILFTILADLNIPFVVDRPAAAAEVGAWIADMEESAGAPLPRRVLLFAIELDGAVVGVLTADLAHRSADGIDEGTIASVEYVAYLRPEARGQGLVRRAIPLLEPKLVSHFGIDRVFAVVDDTNEHALKAIAGFTRITPVGDGKSLYRRPVIGPRE